MSGFSVLIPALRTNRMFLKSESQWKFMCSLGQTSVSR